MEKILQGLTADASIRVYGAVAGEVFTVHNSAATVITSAVADSNGLATIPHSSNLTGYIQSTNRRWPATGSGALDVGNIFECDTSRIGDYGANLLAIDGNTYYPTFQGGNSHNQCAETTNYYYFTYRNKSRNIAILQISKTTRQIIAGPVVVASTPDGHDLHALAAAPDGKLRFVWGGYPGSTPDTNGNGRPDFYYKETLTSENITAWTTDLNLEQYQAGQVFEGVGGAYKVDSLGNDYILGFSSSGGTMFLLYRRAGETNWTWKKIAIHTTSWGALNGDIYIDESTTPATIEIAWANYKTAQPWDAVLSYQKLYHIQSTDFFQTAATKDGTNIPVPFSFNSNGYCVYNGSTPLPIVEDTSMYALIRVVKVAGQTQMWRETNRQTTGQFKVTRWTGSAWASATIVENHAAIWGISMVVKDGVAHVDMTQQMVSGGSWRLRRWSSSDGFQTYTTANIADGALYPPLSAAVLRGPWQWNKVMPDNPSIILFSTINTDQAAQYATTNYGHAASVWWVDTNTLSQTPTLTKPTASRVGDNITAGSQKTGLQVGDTVEMHYRDVNADTENDTIKPDTPGQTIWKPMTLT